MTKLIIARHGNTFGPEDTPTRVGARTDIPLVTAGIEQAQNIGTYCKAHHLMPDVIYSAELKRTRETAAHAFPGQTVTTLACFNEIDYGPDENKTEAEVVARIGQAQIDAWNEHAEVPHGWKVSPQSIINSWIQFANKIQKEHANQTVFLVTSNGIARFAPHLTGDFESFSNQYALKLKTGALAGFSFKDNCWAADFWNVRP